MSPKNNLKPVYRILDANANRLREALRSIEEYFRFCQNDAGLTKRLKALRHDVADALGRFDAHKLLACRNSRQDVGKKTIGSESKRQNPKEVAWVNLKRSQEACRVVEEYSKIIDAKAAEEFKKIRFRLYNFEKTVILS